MIFCFSGTGNSRHVATLLATHLNEQITEMQGDILTNPASYSYDLSNESRVIWVFPIYSWGVPPVVAEFIKNASLTISNNTTHHMVCTCGDDIGNGHKHWRKIIEKRGWIPQSTFSVQMPNTYTLMKGFDVDSKEVEQQKITKSTVRIEEIAQKIASCEKVDDVVRGSWPWTKTAIIYPYFKRYCMSPRPFHATNNCTACGKCAKTCPLNNISMTNNQPNWHDNCALCLRCYHICPSHAVAYGKATKGKGQYQELIHNSSTLSTLNSI